MENLQSPTVEGSGYGLKIVTGDTRNGVTGYNLCGQAKFNLCGQEKCDFVPLTMYKFNPVRFYSSAMSTTGVGDDTVGG